METASEIAAVVEGTLANGPHVRVAALMALARVPAIREGALAEESFLVAALHTACFDTGDCTRRASTDVTKPAACGYGCTLSPRQEPATHRRACTLHVTPGHR